MHRGWTTAVSQGRLCSAINCGHSLPLCLHRPARMLDLDLTLGSRNVQEPPRTTTKGTEGLSHQGILSTVRIG